MSYLVHLQKFEGPMGLLLYLIRKEEMDVFDINITDLTKGYLEHIRLMRELDLEVAGEFVAMAATLLQIKSRMLLPQYGEDGEPLTEVEDPRKELVQKILEYQRFQEAGRQLMQRPLLGRDIWLRGRRENYLGEEDAVGEIILDDEGLFGLISSYRRAIKRVLKGVHQVRAKGQSIAGRILEIKDRLIVGLRVRLSELLSAGPVVRTELLITFLAMLELGRMGFISLYQNENYGEIYIETLKPIERNVLERVQEFEAEDSEALSAKLFADAEETEVALHKADAEDEIASKDSQQSLFTAMPEIIEDEASADSLTSEVASDSDIESAESEWEWKNPTSES